MVNNNGTITLHGVAFQVSYPHAQQEVHVLVEQASVTFVDLHGEILAEHAWPPLGIRYASKHTGQRSGKPEAATEEPRTVTDVLRHQLSPMS